jgi:hypothetical protein
MKGNRAVITAVVVLVVIIVGWWLFGRGSRVGGVDLIDRFAQAEKRPAPELFSVKEVTLAGETKRAITVGATAGTRLTFKVTVPDDGWLWVSVGMDPSVWEKEGDGMKFLVGVSDGRAFEPLFEHHLNPFANAADRKWFPIRVDLSTYAGETVDVIFNTYSSPAGGGDDRRNDMGLWGTPEIVVR